ncbi:glycine betaine ABC transporter substrate-binding protein [Thiohalocapsa marina]|nr:glycine betaine ABC transporter substrate-binding protein [Thiohalocapsa marina]
MNPTLFSRLAATLLILGLLLSSGCGRDRAPLIVGGKQSPENQIVAEMVAALAEEAGIPVLRRIGLGTTRQTLEAMKRGEIDIYPEYTGTGLTMLGQAQLRDPDAALARVRERFAPLGLGWSEPLGFDNDYGLAMLNDRARLLGIKTISNLARRAPQLSLGVDDEFQQRPIDGLQPLLRRYGMRFGSVLEVPLRERSGLYDMLIERRIDVSLITRADPQIEEFDLRVLQDDLAFFPNEQAALLYREQALARFPALATVLGQLAGRISDERIRTLQRRVVLRGEDPGVVARAELMRLGLIEGFAAQAPRQALNVAISPSANADGEAAAVLRALRRSFPARDVRLVPAPDPLGEVQAGNARVALVSAPAFFSPGSIDPLTGQPPLRSGVEAVALVGNSYLHLFALRPDVGDLQEARRIVTSAEGSSGYRAAESMIDAYGLDAELVPVEGADAQALADAMLASAADIALLMQPIGNWTVLELFERGLTLLSVGDWSSGSNRIVFPYLQGARLSTTDYPQLRQPVETLVTQLVLAGPAPLPDSAIGNHGPGANFIPTALPLTNQSVDAINAALNTRGQINPILPQAAALAPELPSPPARINPSPAVSVLTLFVVALLGWLVWLLYRRAPV